MGVMAGKPFLKEKKLGHGGGHGWKAIPTGAIPTGGPISTGVEFIDHSRNGSPAMMANQ